MPPTRLTRAHPRPEAGGVDYDNTDSGLVADDLQEAIDELADLIDDAGGGALDVAAIETHHRFVITAHMGDVNPTDGYPEGSMEGYRQAVRRGCHRIDLDCRQSSDGTWYSMHDSTLDRTTNLSGAISSASDATINGGHIDGGTGYDAGRHGSSIGIPTVAEIVTALAPYDCTFQLENKVATDASATSLAELAVSLGVAHRSLISADTSEVAAIEAVSTAIGIIGDRAEANDWATPTWDDLVDEDSVYAYAPRKVSGVVPREDFGTADEEAIVTFLWGIGARGITSNDIQVAVATWQSFEYPQTALDYGEDGDISTLDYDDVPDAGVLDEVARADHVHGMPSASSGGGIGPILISDTPSTPLVFADLIQNEAQDDLVYADP